MRKDVKFETAGADCLAESMILSYRARPAFQKPYPLPNLEVFKFRVCPQWRASKQHSYLLLNCS